MASPNPPPYTAAAAVATVATDTSIDLACHCKAVTLTIPHIPPILNACPCTICYHYGAMWAYYPRNEVLVTVAAGERTETYIWGDRMLEFHRCGKCGCVTHWWAREEYSEGPGTKMGVNGRLLGREVVEGRGIKVRYGRSMGKEDAC